MSHRSLLAVTLLAAFLTTPALAPAQRSTGPPCGPRKHVVEFLDTRFGERLIARGLAESGQIVEIYASSKGTWTIIATAPSGVSCLIAGGEAWETLLTADQPV